MALKLNTATSVVDFLKSQGKASDFASRKSLYETSGLRDRLGEYTGSSSQNVAFLKSLQTPQQPPESVSPEPVAANPPVDKPAEPAPISATDTLASLGVPALPSSEQLLNQALGSTGFKLASEKLAAGSQADIASALTKKEELKASAAAKTKEFIESQGRRGLFFSGATESGVESLVQSLAASQLGVDRELAQKLLNTDLSLQQEIFNRVEEVTKQAQAGRKEAIAALNDVGLTVIGDRVVPTLASQREERQQRAEERLAETSEANRLATERRLQLSEDAATRAEAYLRLAEARAGQKGAITSGDVTFSSDQISSNAQVLNQARGQDGWTDPNLYQRMFNSWTSQGGLPQDFLRAFPPTSYINPRNKSLPAFLQNKGGTSFFVIPESAVVESLEEE